jgi:hypothetical protein
MSGSDQYPAPGSPPPGPPPGPPSSPAPPYPAPPYPAPAYPTAPYPTAPYPQAAYPQAAYPGPHPAGPYAPPVPGGFLGAAHKPGAIPLRPLRLGDIYDAAFRIIRFNPKATVGSAVLVAAASMAIPVLLTAALTFVLDMSLDPEASDFSQGEAVGMISSFGSLGLGQVLQSLGLILVTGMLVHVTAAAAIGRRMTLGEAWAATRGKRWRLIGLALLLFAVTLMAIGVYGLLWVALVVASPPVAAVVTFGVVTGPLFLAFMCWFWIRVYYLPVPALMLEPVGVFGAIGRGYRLTARAFWRTFGIALLTLVIAQVAGGMLGMPFGLLGQVGALAGAGTRYLMLLLVLSQALTSVVTAAFVAPFTGTVTSLQYFDQRIRKEAYDVELMTRAGITQG